MKTSALAILFLTIIACTNNTPSTLVKGSENEPGQSIKTTITQLGGEGFYTGMFEPKNNNDDAFSNKITICIESLNEHDTHGYSVVAGNKRPFSGTCIKQNDSYIVSAKEPGNEQYDGAFEFTLNPKEKKLKGTWKSDDKAIKVTERSYELQYRKFKYDPSLALPEVITEEVIYGTYNEETAEKETVTSDALKINASREVLTSGDIENMYKGDLEVMRNSIYARHGYSFKNLRMRRLFDEYVSWYMPVSTNVTAQLTKIEQRNIELIKRYEAHANKNYDDEPDYFGR